MLKGRARVALALFAVLSALVAACAEAPEEAAPGPDDGEEVDFLACQVTDVGGIDDKSFNQTAWEGLEAAEEELGVQTSFLESQSPEDFEPNIEAFIDQGCDLIVTVGFLLGDATAEAAKDHPDQKFAIVDFNFFDEEEGKDIVFENVKELTFQTDQAAFLAGYLAAGMSESGKLGTFGGINIPPVTIFMNGFEAGMNHFNQQHDAGVDLLGWDIQKQDGLFTGDFEDQQKGREVTESLINEGADIVMPVAGPVGLGSAAAAQAAGDVALVWVDTDGCISAEEYCDLFLTSVMKNMDVAVFDTVKAALEDTFEGGLYVGTLENDGVGIAPYHEFEDDIPEELKTEVEELRGSIEGGTVDVGE